MSQNSELRVPYGLSVHGEEEIEAVIEVLRTTTQMSKNVSSFEGKIAELFSMDYGVMVNSGSSALYVLIESLKGYKLLTDEIILFNNSNLVKSSNDVIFTSGNNDTLYGTGFWSNFDMSNSQIQSPKGSMSK